MFEAEGQEHASPASKGRFGTSAQAASGAAASTTDGQKGPSEGAGFTGSSTGSGGSGPSKIAGKAMAHWGDSAAKSAAPAPASSKAVQAKAAPQSEDGPERGRHETAANTETRAPGLAQSGARGERAWAALGKPVQPKAESGGAFSGAGGAGGPDGAQAQQTALEGLAGGGQPLPHLEAIAQSFGHHKVHGIQALIGGKAGAAAKKIGAQAYASGEKIAFQSAPDLHTAAHEAAHVVQQRGGVQLPNGVGQQGDAYETHANEVADLVVRGQSAEALLDRYAPGPAQGEAAKAASAGPVQRDGGGAIASAADISKDCHLVARVPAGVLLGAGLQDPITDALAREIWCHTAAGDGQVYYLNCPADSHIHFLDDKGVPLRTAKSFFQAKYDQILQNPRVQPVSGNAATDRSRQCANAIRAAFDTGDGQEILRQLSLGAEVVRAAVRIYDSELNTLSGQGLVADFKEQFPGLLSQAVLQLQNAGVAVAEDTGVDRAQDSAAILKDARIVATPASALVTPGTSLTYSVQLPLMWAASDYQTHGAWSRLLDPFTTPKGNSSFDFLSGPIDALSWTTKWDTEGSYKIQCAIIGTWSNNPWMLPPFRDWQSDPRAVMLEYDQVVLPAQVATDFAFAASSASDPREQVAQLQKMLEALRAAAKSSGQALDPSIETAIQSQIDKISGLLASTSLQQRTPIHAVHVATENGQVTPLQVLVASPQSTVIATPAPGGGSSSSSASSAQQTWQLIDATNASDERLHGTYSGTGATAAEAIRAAIEDWKTHSQYPIGTIKLEVPQEVAGEAIADQFATNGNSWADLSQFLQAVGTVASIVGTVGALICPAFGLVALAGGIIGAAGAAVNMAQRHYYRTATLGSDGMDLLTIATAFFSAGRALGKGAKILSQGVERGLIVGEFVANGTQFVVMNAQFIQRATAAMAIQDPQKRLEALLEVLKDAVINDGMTLLSLKGLANDYQAVGREAPPAEIQSDLNDGSKTIQLDDLPPPQAATDAANPAATDPAAATGTGTDTAVTPDQASGLVDSNGVPTLTALQNPMRHPEWKAFETAMARFGVGSAKAEELWTKVLTGLAHGETEFAEVTAFLKETSGITSFKKPALWSGNLMGALADHLGFDTMGKTSLGGALAPLRLGDWGAARPFWVAMSRAFTSELRGTVDVFMSQWNPGSIVVTDELKVVAELQAAGLVSEVHYHAIDPTSVGGGVEHSVFLDAQGNPHATLVNLASPAEVQAALAARASAVAAGAAAAGGS